MSVDWEIEVRNAKGGFSYGDFKTHHKRKKDAVAEAERINSSPHYAKLFGGCTAHVIRVERTLAVKGTRK